jgi:hypothetical protein
MRGHVVDIIDYRQLDRKQISKCTISWDVGIFTSMCKRRVVSVAGANIEKSMNVAGFAAGFAARERSDV